MHACLPGSRQRAVGFLKKERHAAKNESPQQESSCGFCSDTPGSKRLDERLNEQANGGHTFKERKLGYSTSSKEE